MSQPAAVEPAAAEGQWKWWTLVAVCIATLMLLLDVTIVNVALPDISRDLGSSFADLQWVIDAYALGLAALLLTWGGISDQIGRKRVFMLGLAGFTIASGLCASATTPLWLNIARGLQGMGGAAMFATALALLASAYDGKDRGTAIGLWGATIGAGVAVGPLIGGILIEVASWHWIFLVNIPIGLIGLVLSQRYVPESKNPFGRGIDVPGALSFSLALFLLIFAIVRGNAEGWGSGLIVGCFVGAAVLLAAFFVVQVRSPKAMFDLGLFRNRSFVGVSLAAFALSSAMFALFLYITLWIQNGLRYSPLEAGLRFLPSTLLSFFVAPIAGKLSAKVAPNVILGGGLGLVGIALLLMTRVDGDSDWTALLPGLIVGGIGIGATNPALASIAVGVVDVRRSGMASGINSTFRQVGIAMGTAIWGAWMASLVESSARDSVTASAGAAVAAKLPDGDALTQAQAGLIDKLPGGQAMYLDAYTSGLQTVFLAAGIFALVSAAIAFALVRRSDFVGQPAAAPPEPAAEPATA
ncbi:MAG: MFS transporter [Solirubrobacteraceae bacterium]|nr:MFS transporter [Solirubrobacteraceae bacterium]